MKKRYILLLAAACVAFIFLNSLMNSNISSAQSVGVLRLLRRFFAAFGMNPAMLTEHLVRKAAHFCEYALLGFLLALTFGSFCSQKRGWMYQPLFLGLAIPVLDESLQLTIPGRTGRLQDVLLDFAGVLFGMLVWRLSVLLAGRIRSGRRRAGIGPAEKG